MRNKKNPLCIAIGDIGSLDDNQAPRQFTISLAKLEDSFDPTGVFKPVSDGNMTVIFHCAEEVIYLSGKLNLSVMAQCARCLADASINISTPLAVTLFPEGGEPTAGSDGELCDSDMDISTYSDDMIDLGCVFRDEVLLGLPMIPLCSENCAGLCVECGINLNNDVCGCKPRIDGKLSGLADIKLN